MYLSKVVKAKELVTNAMLVYQGKLNGDNPITLNGINFYPNELGYCQKNIRKIVECTVWKEEWTWHQSSCCAGNTCKKLKQAGITETTWKKMNSGDIVYMNGGKNCSVCGNPVGHVVLLVKNDDINNRLFWQNTSSQKLGMCVIPMTDAQINRITGIFKILPQ